MDRSKPKGIFPHQSGMIKAVQADLEGVLEDTKVMVEKVKSDPPPKETLRPIKDAGLYSVTLNSDNEGELIDRVKPFSRK